MNIGIIGHFADGKEIYDGQTVKTRNIYEALKNDYNPIKLDTYEWKNKKIDTFINCIKMLKNNKNIIILTAQRGLFVFIPLFAILNVFFKKKIHYVVVGAWLEEKIKNNIPLIEENVKQIFSENNYDMNFDINYGLNYFPEKEYRGLKYNEGYYESVVISIGKAEGDNWWCVLFPNLCLVDLETKDNVEYKSWIVEKINKIF